MNLIIRIAISALGLWVAVQLVNGLDFTGDFWRLILVAVVFGLINALIWPIAAFLSLPLIVITLGLFLFVLNWFMFWLLIWLSEPARLDLGLTSTGFWPTTWGAVIVALVSWAASLLLKDSKGPISTS